MRRPYVKEEEEVYPVIVRPTLQLRPKITSDTIVISEKGGEQILKVLPAAKETAAAPAGEPAIDREKQNVDSSETVDQLGL